MGCGLSWQDPAKALYAGCPWPSRDGDGDGSGGSKGINLSTNAVDLKSFGILGFGLVCGLAKKHCFGLLSQPRRNRSTVVDS